MLLASTGKTRTLTSVRLFVHAAARSTSYLGFMRAPFVDAGADRKLGEINTTVPPGSRPVGTSVIARVTSEPGSYSLIISVEATQAGTTDPERIAQEVPVLVK